MIDGGCKQRASEKRNVALTSGAETQAIIGRRKMFTKQEEKGRTEQKDAKIKVYDLIGGRCRRLLFLLCPIYAFAASILLQHRRRRRFLSLGLAVDGPCHKSNNIYA